MLRSLARPALAVGACLLLGCAGTNPVDPCAGVTCSPGRICVKGVCQSGGGYDTGFNLDGWVSQDSGGADLDAALTADALAVDTLVPDALSPDSTPPDTSPQPDQSVGRWYQVDKDNCPTFCTGKGLSNTPSPDNCRCMSGEARPASGIAQGIKFTYGTTGTGLAQAGISTTSYGKYCYRPQQKQDDDKTDFTVGCFCR